MSAALVSGATGLLGHTGLTGLPAVRAGDAAVGLLIAAGLLLLLPRQAGRAAVPGEPAPAGRPGVLARAVARGRDDLVRAGLRSRGGTRLAAGTLLLGVLGGVATLALTRVGTIALAVGLATAALPYGMVRHRARASRARLRESWPDVVDDLTSAVRAGLSLPEALAQLARRGPRELRPAFAAFERDHRTGARFDVCLDRLKGALADPVGDRLVESLRISRAVGGSDLGRLLRTLSAFLRQENRTRAELETRQGWSINAARLAVAAPWLVLLMLASQPGSLAAYGSPAGGALLAVGGAGSALAYVLMRRIGRLPTPQRVLR